jgi:hypothetical protein
VKKEAAVRWHFPLKESERRQYAIARIGIIAPTAFLADAKRREPKTGGRDARHHATVGSVDFDAVFDKAGVRMSLLPEEQESPFFDLIQ